MTKRTVVACLIAACVAGVPSAASARGLDDIWDILDALSGPGPFKGAPIIAATVACWEDGDAVVTGSATARLD